MAKVWKDYDLNKDNKISWEEYKQASYGYYLGKKILDIQLHLFTLIGYKTEPNSDATEPE